jgi:hypothetical protein
MNELGDILILGSLVVLLACQAWTLLEMNSMRDALREIKLLIHIDKRILLKMEESEGERIEKAEGRAK